MILYDIICKIIKYSGSALCGSTTARPYYMGWTRPKLMACNLLLEQLKLVMSWNSLLILLFIINFSDEF